MLINFLIDRFLNYCWFKLVMKRWNIFIFVILIVSLPSLVFAIGDCIDYDKGRDYNVSSYIIDENGLRRNDYCSNNTLVEYVCENNKGTATFYVCPRGCEEGACTAFFVSDICNFNGLCEQDKGESNINCLPDCPVICNYDGICEEYYGENEAGCSDCQKIVSLCNMNGKCELGYNETYVACPDDCYCGDGICDFEEGRDNSCLEDCDINCEDSDGGTDYYLRGSIKGLVNDSEVIFRGVDCCIQDNVDLCVEESNTLIEYYCEDGKVEFVVYHCPNGCLEGECILNSYECFGCVYGQKCFDEGHRFSAGRGKWYCGFDGLNQQKVLGDGCENNYECESYYCNEGKCSIKLREPKTWLGKFLRFLGVM